MEKKWEQIKIYFKSLSFRKKQFLVWLVLFIGIGCLSLVLVSLPWVKNKSALTVLVEKYGNVKNYNSSDIWDLFLKVLTWTALVWGIALKIQQTILIKKERIKYMKFFKKHNLEKKANVNGKPVELSKRQINKQIVKNEYIADDYISKLQNACDTLGFQFKGGISIEVRSILTNLNFDKEDKINAISDLLNRSGINVDEHKNIEKTIKEI